MKFVPYVMRCQKGEVIADQRHNYVNGTCTNCGQDDPDLNRTYALRYITVGEQTDGIMRT